MLEDSKRSRTLRQLVVTESKYITVNCLRLLLSTAQIEQNVKQMYKDVCKITRYYDNYFNAQDSRNYIIAIVFTLLVITRKRDQVAER